MSKKLQIGKTYRIVKNLHGHFFKMGDTVTIQKQSGRRTSRGFWASDGQSSWVIEIEEVEESDAPVSLREEPQERVWKELREQQYEEDMDMDQFLDYLERNYNISKK